VSNVLVVIGVSVYDRDGVDPVAVVYFIPRGLVQVEEVYGINSPMA
jgi:hypothetical protein